MDLSAPVLWWIAAGALVAIEMATGTFYLLMLALGCAAGALLAHTGASASMQWVAAALMGGGATAVWHLKRARSPRSAPSESNRDVNLDIGQSLHVADWAPDGTARAHYRGAAWSVQFEGTGTPAPGEHVIVAVRGSQLRVAPAGSQR
jgi:membrane protein implicated in regulation of membrane protease activity